MAGVVDTICYHHYPTSYKAGVAPIGQAPAAATTSYLFSIIYQTDGLQARHLRMLKSPMMIIQANYSGGSDPLILQYGDPPIG